MKIPDWKLERMHLGELPIEAGAEASMAELARSDAAILEAHAPADVAAEVERRRRVDAAHRDFSRRRRGMLALVPVGAAIAAAFLLAPRDPGSHLVGSGTEVILEKGDGPSLRVYRQAEKGAERLQEGAAVHAGDRLQLATVGMGAYGVVVSIDGRGGVTLHFPTSEAAPTKLPQGESPLPSSYELDDAPGFERFFLVTSEAPVRVPAVMDAARRLATSGSVRGGILALPQGVQQTSLLLVKP